MSVNPSLKPILKRILEISPEDSDLRRRAVHMLREIFLEELEYSLVPFRGPVNWISPTKEVENVQEKTKEEI